MLLFAHDYSPVACKTLYSSVILSEFSPQNSRVWCSSFLPNQRQLSRVHFLPWWHTILSKNLEVSAEPQYFTPKQRNNSLLKNVCKPSSGNEEKPLCLGLDPSILKTKTLKVWLHGSQLKTHIACKHFNLMLMVSHNPPSEDFSYS